MSASVSRTAVVAAPPGDAWEVLADFGALARWVPEVDHACLLRGGPPGVGTTRRVQVGRTTLLETVRAWSPPVHLGY
ncbi:MAG TPA: MxaD family protein, partial [Acidimicrobiaceae bacterium]|nr:MxaD family protein [Acidimicrobiaceae bacterium]